MYALDSSICIDFMRGRLPGSYELLSQDDPRLYKIPAIVEGELYLGAEKDSNPERKRRLVEKFLAPFEVVPFDSKCALTYAQIRAKLERQGKLIGPNDMLIAATAVANNLVLITNNVKEFKRVPGLSLESWHEVDMENPDAPKGLS